MPRSFLPLHFSQAITSAATITITAIAPVGNYAVRITFDDGHDTGIYSWSLLQDYAARQDRLMANYLDRLDSLGLSRDA